MNRTVAHVVVGIGLFCLTATVVSPLPAAAQRLWSVEETRPRPPGELPGVVVSAATGVVDNSTTAKAATVQVNFDYLRLGMGYLELPLWDGSVIAAENAVLEQRGNGNLLWTGEVPGAGYESVLFTLQDGHLIGWFGEPGGPKYTVHAGPDGSGTVAVEEGPTGDWCGTETGRGAGSSFTRSRASISEVPAASSNDTLDILLLYSGLTERWWRSIGGTTAGVRQLEDYLNMVFRNGEIPAEAKLIPVRWEPTAVNSPTFQGAHREPQYAACLKRERAFAWPEEAWLSDEVADLRARHAADAIYFAVTSDSRTLGIAGVYNGVGGRAGLRTHLNPEVGVAWGSPDGLILAHELGHTLGAQHEPYDFRGRFEAVRAATVRPFAFGHTDLRSCAPEVSGGRPYCPGTIMVGSSTETLHKVDGYVINEPFYSSVRYRPNGWTIGVAGERENERLLQETVPIALRNSDSERPFEQNVRSVEARWVARDRVRVTWLRPRGSSSFGMVRLAAVDGTNEVYPVGLRPERENVTPIVPDGPMAGAEISGLRPGASWKISVVVHVFQREVGRHVPELTSNVFELGPPTAHPGAPAAPNRIGVQVAGPTSLRLSWTGDQVADGYEVWYRRWSGEDPDAVWRRHGEPLAADVRSVVIKDLVADEEIDNTQLAREWPGMASVGRYSFVVVADNDEGFSASDPFDYEFMPGPHPEATAAGETSDCFLRYSGLELDGYMVHMCMETPDGARRRVWDYGLDAQHSGLLYFFDRDNVEVLVKVLDGCALNGHRWVFVAPVTTLAFRLRIREVGPLHGAKWRASGNDWFYDSEDRGQQRILPGGVSGDSAVGNPQGRTARTVSDTMAFPCTPAETAAAATSSKGTESAFAPADLGQPFLSASNTRLTTGSRTDCVPGGPTLTLRGGYRVSMCYETYEGRVGDARDWGLDSSQSGLLYFFERNNVEVLIKVLDGCGVNGHRWVFVAPVTDLAFNLHIESPTGERWTHTNRLGQTADTAAHTSAFPCTSSVKGNA